MRTTTERHGTQAPEGYWWVAVPETDPNWRLQSEGRCRYGRPSCKAPAAAALKRGLSGWWAYCEQHLFGRWIEDGQLWHWVLREIGEDNE